MPASEFELIEQFFNCHQSKASSPHLVLGIGDDGAVLKVPGNHQLVVTMDTLISGHHYPQQTLPQDIAYKSLAVNVSDLAAMGAVPGYFVLSLTMPEMDVDFLEKFSAGLFDAADEFGIPLVGGDTCKGPLSITIQASGYVPDGQYITRSGANPGDRLFVSGELGSAAVGLACLLKKVEMDTVQKNQAMIALNRPYPRLDLVPVLQKFASSAIDLSDGLLGDIAHILKKSCVGAVIDQSNIPVFDWIRLNDEYRYALTGGDDYQILFTVAEKDVSEMMQMANSLAITLYDIGEITKSGLFMSHQNQLIDVSGTQGYDHFAA